MPDRSEFELQVEHINLLCKDGDLIGIRKFDLENARADLLPYIDIAYRGALEKLAAEGRYDEIAIFGNINTYMELRPAAKIKLVEVLGEYEGGYIYLHSYLNNEPIPALASLIEDELIKSFSFVYALPNRGLELFAHFFLKTTHSDRIRMAAIGFLALNGQLEPIRGLLTPDKETFPLSNKVRAYAESTLVTKSVQMGLNVGKEMARRAPLAKVPGTHLSKARN